MLFNSFVFYLFFAAFFAAYLALRARRSDQNVLILAGSYLFYGWWDERFLSLIALSTACDFLAGIGASGVRLRRAEALKAMGLAALAGAAAFGPTLSENIAFAGLALLAALGLGLLLLCADAAPARWRRRAFLWVSLSFNLGLLATFKYFGFFAESFAALAQRLGMQADAPTLSIILPIGISFYTFQTLSYTIDISRGVMKPTRRIVDFAAYVSFFPQLVAGPIERARRLLPQFAAPRAWDAEKAQSGAFLFLWGLYKKTVIADNAARIADAAFAAPAESDPAFMTLGVLAFTVQIFCDFSGYSDMARGLARLLGFELMVNFDLPYFSRTPSEFWRRWHISLSTWLRDYLYVPLGGNRGGRLATCRNLLITMLLGGLWHGAAWTFVAWGAFHGGVLTIYRLLNVDDALARIRAAGVWGRAAHTGAWGVMMILTLIGWTLFRATSLDDAGAALAGLGTAVATGAILTEMPRLSEWTSFVGYVWPLAAVQLVRRFAPEVVDECLEALRRPSAPARFVRANAALILAFTVLFLPAEGQQQFIYFDF